ncbi:immunity 52 family protein [Chitinimonas sp. PSY-7]|uniref:Imm52 family immunity protein n=1 Tax=Chitinimonas sp. PSY-7 TaxID=3459088 RepID=UPI00404012BF
MDYVASYRPAASMTLHDELQNLFLIRQYLASVSPIFKTWFLGGDTKDEAYLYEVFDEAGPTTAATAVLVNETKKDTKIRAFGMWNGIEGEEDASLQVLFSQLGGPSMFTFSTDAKVLGKYEFAETISKELIRLWQPSVLTVGPLDYDDEKVFQDRPGIGWMLYLPRKLTADQVPEARALVPIMDGKKQTGTIIVSQTEEAFDAANPEHVAVANAIEVRLVDQDLLPLYTEL